MTKDCDEDEEKTSDKNFFRILRVVCEITLRSDLSTLSQCYLTAKYYPGQKNRYSRDIHEIDRQCDHLISCDIDFDLQRELATRRGRESRRCRSEARYRTISHDRTVDQLHEFLGCNDFFGQGSIFLRILRVALEIKLTFSFG